MDFVDQLKALSARIPQQLEHMQTEEATKTALIMPFIAALGYNVFDPREVVPEFTADMGIKKGEKVDYAIVRDGKPIMLFECKKAGAALADSHASQLFRYFTVTPAKIGVLTNGIQYRFFTDLEETNKMDSKPFLVFDLAECDEYLAGEVKKLARESFDIPVLVSAAKELKYNREFKLYLSQQLVSLSDDFADLMVRQVYSGRIMQKILADLKPVISKALKQFVDEQAEARLRSALNKSSRPTTPDEQQSQASSEESSDQADEVQDSIDTTVEEMEGFFVVKAILREVVDPRRIAHRDVQSYFGILLDDNNRKPICRLYLNGSRWYIGLFDKERKEERVPISDLNDIFKYAERLVDTIMNYDVK